MRSIADLDTAVVEEAAKADPAGERGANRSIELALPSDQRERSAQRQLEASIDCGAEALLAHGQGLRTRVADLHNPDETLEAPQLSRLAVGRIEIGDAGPTDPGPGSIVASVSERLAALGAAAPGAEYRRDRLVGEELSDTSRRQSRSPDRPSSSSTSLQSASVDRFGSTPQSA